MLVEVLSTLERRRCWSQGDNARIIEEMLASRRTVTEFARRNSIAASLAFTWPHASSVLPDFVRF